MYKRQVFDKDKQLYYTCLQKYDEEEKLEPLFEFLKYETEQTWKRTIEIAEKSEPRKGLDEYI